MGRDGGSVMKKYELLDWVHFAIQEALNENMGELEKALEIIEMLREMEEV
jgi:hypothetical protein